MRCPKCGNPMNGITCNICRCELKRDSIRSIESNSVYSLGKYIQEAEEARKVAARISAEKATAERLAREAEAARIAAEKEQANIRAAELTVAEQAEREKAEREAARISAEKATVERRAKEEADRRAAAEVILAINEIGTVSGAEECGRQIRAARLAYSNLTIPQRSLVTNEHLLRAAESEYGSLSRTADELAQKRKLRRRIVRVICPIAVIVVAAIVLFKTGVISFKRKPATVNDAFFVNAQVGDEFILGKYEQDNNMSNGSEDIEWVVLSNNNGLILALSKYCLDDMPYHEEQYDENGNWVSVDWENCTLRQWLNNSFYNTAFSDSEKLIICSTNLENPDSPIFYTPGGNNTTDSVFLLSSADIQNVFDDYGFGLLTIRREVSEENQKLAIGQISSNQVDYPALKTQYTKYAKENYIQRQVKSWNSTEQEQRKSYAEIESKYGDRACSWWLRTPGTEANTAMIISWPGQALTMPTPSHDGVRPAILISEKKYLELLSIHPDNVTLPITDKTEGNSAKVYFPESNDTQLPTTAEDEAYDNYPVQMVASSQQVVYVTNNGIVFRAGFLEEFEDVYSWSSIQKIVVDQECIIGITREGKVEWALESELDFNWDAIAEIENVVDVAICRNAINEENDSIKGCVLLLTEDHTMYVFFAGNHKSVGIVENVVSISASANNFVAVKEDGTLAGRNYGDDDLSDVIEWTDIQAIAVGEHFVAGLKNDGTVVTAGTFLPAELNGIVRDYDGSLLPMDLQLNTSNWANITSISAGDNHLVGLCDDGTVLSVGLNNYGQCDTTGWNKAITIEASHNTTFALTEDGYVMIAGEDIIYTIAALQGQWNAYIGYSR